MFPRSWIGAVNERFTERPAFGMYRPRVVAIQRPVAMNESRVPPDHLSGIRFSLRALRPRDWPLELALSRDVEARRWIPYPQDMDAEVAKERISTAEKRTAEGVGRRYAIVAADGRGVGTCGLAFGGEDPEVSYALLSLERGRGAATEATRLLSEWVLGQAFPRVVLRTDEGNTASEAVARRAGFAPTETYEETNRGARVIVTRWTKEPPNWAPTQPSGYPKHGGER